MRPDVNPQFHATIPVKANGFAIGPLLSGWKPPSVFNPRGYRTPVSSRVVGVPKPDGGSFADGPSRGAVTTLADGAVKVFCPAKGACGFNFHGGFAALEAGPNGDGVIFCSHAVRIVSSSRIVKRFGRQMDDTTLGRLREAEDGKRNRKPPTGFYLGIPKTLPTMGPVSRF